MRLNQQQKAQGLLEYALLTAISIVSLLAVLRFTIVFNGNRNAFKDHFDIASYYIGGVGVMFDK